MLTYLMLHWRSCLLVRRSAWLRKCSPCMGPRTLQEGPAGWALPVCLGLQVNSSCAAQALGTCAHTAAAALQQVASLLLAAQTNAIVDQPTMCREVSCVSAAKSSTAFCAKNSPSRVSPRSPAGGRLSSCVGRRPPEAHTTLQESQQTSVGSGAHRPCPFVRRSEG